MEIYGAYKLCIKPTEAQAAAIENTFMLCIRNTRKVEYPPLRMVVKEELV